MLKLIGGVPLIVFGIVGVVLAQETQAPSPRPTELQQAAPCRDAGRARAGIVSVPGCSGTNTGGHWRSVEMRHGISPWIVISEGFVRKGRARF